MLQASGKLLFFFLFFLFLIERQSKTVAGLRAVVMVARQELDRTVRNIPMLSSLPVPLPVPFCGRASPRGSAAFPARMLLSFGVEPAWLQRCCQRWAPAPVRPQALPLPPTAVLWSQGRFLMVERGHTGMCPHVLLLLPGTSAVHGLLCMRGWLASEAVVLAGSATSMGSSIRPAARWLCLMPSGSRPEQTGVCRS